MAGGRRNRLQGAPPKWADIRGLLHMRLKDAAAQLNVPITHLRRLCRQNGFRQWPGKRIRYLQSTGRNVMLEVDALDGSPWAGLAGPSSQLAKILETQKQEEEEEEEEDEEVVVVEDTTRIHEPMANPPPEEKLTTLNLIDKVGSSSGSERS